MAAPPSSKTHDKFRFWSTSNNYALALICWSNTLGNARKFPALFHKHGNLQVLLPYCVVTALLIIPFVFVELTIGQYTNNGFVNMWRMAPILRGLIWSTATITFFVTHYSLFTTTHAAYYLLKSFETTLPWSKCDPTWATEICINVYNANQNYPNRNLTNVQNSVEHFYRKLVLSEDALSFAEINVRLFAFLLATLVIIGVCLFERVKSIEKLQKFVIIAPFILLLALTLASLVNQTSFSELSIFFEPNFELLLDYNLWVDVVNNAMTNIGLGMGGVICIAAHGNFRSNIYRFAVLTPLCNLLIDVLFTLFVYSNLAAEAIKKNTTFDAIFQHDASLLFVKIPAALLEWPSYQQAWTIAYFLYLYLTGARYLLFLLFTLTSGFHETFHCVYQLRKFSIAVLCFIITFVMPLYISPIGYAMFLQMEDFCSSTFLTFIATIESIGIFYIYNAKNLLIDVHFMLNKRMNNVLYIFYAIPVVLMVVTVANFYQWVIMPRNYKIIWIFIIQCVIIGIMTLFLLSYMIAFIIMHWEGGYRLILAPAANWGCSNDEMRTNRQMFTSNKDDASLTYRQELYQRSITGVN